MGERVRLFCPDYPHPSGGVRQIYRMADLLNAMGHTASVVHQKPGFAATWFEHSTPTESGEIQVGPREWFVLPEEMAHELGPKLRGIRKVIYNQNAYLTFQGTTLQLDGKYSPYLDPEVLATIAISDDTAAYVSHAFPRARVLRHRYDADPGRLFVFATPAQKRNRLAYMPRKNAGDALQVLQILRARRAIVGWEIQAIDKLSPQQTAQALREAAVFLGFGHPEGCPLPPAEAMLSGCVVVGYHGNGGREYLTPERGFPVPVGQIIDFARAAEDVLGRWHADPNAFAPMCTRAHDHIRASFSAEVERESARQIWAEIFAMA